MGASLPDNETERLATLHDLQILDTLPEQEYDDLVRLAAHLCGTPIAAVSLIDEHRQWFKSITGLDAVETPRDIAFCAHTILQNDIMVVPDAQIDPRFADNLLVTGDPHIRFYAGVPLMTEEGHALGALCVIDTIPRQFTSDQEATLALLARQVASHLRAARRIAEREQLVAEKERLAAIVETSADAIYSKTLDGRITSWNGGAEQLYGYTASEMIGQFISVIVPPDYFEELDRIMDSVRQGVGIAPVETVRLTKTGGRVTVSLRVSPVRDAQGTIVGASMIALDIIEQKLAAEAVLASKMFAQAALDGLSAEIAVVDSEGVILAVNQAWRIFAEENPCRSESVSEGANYLAVCDRAVGEESEDAHLSAAGIRAVASGDLTMFTLEYPCHSPVEQRWYCLRATRFPGDGPVRVVIAHENITDRKQAEAAVTRTYTALAESEARMAEAQRVSMQGSWEYDLVTDKITWSDELFRLFGRDPADGEPDYEVAISLYHPEDAPLLDLLVTRAAKEGIGYSLDLRGVPSPLPNVPTKWYQTSGSAFKDTSGQVIRLTGTLMDITERKQIELAFLESQERLEAREQRLRLALSSGRLGIGEMDKITGRFDEASDMYKAHFGLPPAVELTRSMLFELTHPDDRAAVREAVQSAEDEHHLLEIEHRVIWPDGSLHWIKGYSQMIYDDTGKACRMIGMNQDITDRKLDEQTLRESSEAFQKSEEAMQALLESAPVILFATDIEGTITLSKGSGLSALGLKPGEAVGASVYDFGRIDVHISDYVHRALVGESASYDVLINGTWLHNELRPLWDANGAINGVIGVCFDVTERIVSEEKFRVLFEWSSDAHLLFDETGVIDCNEAAVAMMGCSDKSQLLSLHPAILSPEYQPDGQRSLEKCIEMDRLARENGYHRFDWAHRKLDGTEFPVEVTLTPVTLAGHPVILTVWHDLSERKLAEKRLEEYAIVLEYQKGELEKANTELETLATTDGLTGLKNHRAFQERLSEEVTRSQRYRTPLSVIMLDVDQFKQFNDTFGHPAGDKVLKSVAHIIQSCARSTDLAARYGGEEFVILLPETDIEGASVYAERVRLSIESHVWPIRSITVSCGAAAFRLGEESGAEMLSRADKMLYRSKSAGRNRVSCDGLTQPISAERRESDQEDWLGRERRRKRIA